VAALAIVMGVIWFAGFVPSSAQARLIHAAELSQNEGVAPLSTPSLTPRAECESGQPRNDEVMRTSGIRKMVVSGYMSAQPVLCRAPAVTWHYRIAKSDSSEGWGRHVA
jgi:hypothetical protein